MGRNCVVCWSPNRSIYEDMILIQRSNYEGVISKAKEHGETFSKSALGRHINSHCIKMITARKEASKLREQIIEEEIYKDISIAKTLRRNLEICSNEIEQRIKDREHLQSSPGEESMLLKYMGEARMLTDILLKWSDKINVNISPKEDLFEKLTFCLKDFPPELLEKFNKNWIEWNEKEWKERH